MTHRRDVGGLARLDVPEGGAGPEIGDHAPVGVERQVLLLEGLVQRGDQLRRGVGGSTASDDRGLISPRDPATVLPVTM